MRLSLHKFAIAITCLVSLLATAEASAIYDPGTGRFLQRDPSGTPGFNAPRMASGFVTTKTGSFLQRDRMSGQTAVLGGQVLPAGGVHGALSSRSNQRNTNKMYPDGMNLYAAYHVMDGSLDPSGLAKLNWKEKCRCVWHCGVLDCKKAKKIGDALITETQKRYPNSVRNGKGDAWRHCTWNCKMGRELINGRRCAKKISDINEDAGNRQGQPKN